MAHAAAAAERAAGKGIAQVAQQNEASIPAPVRAVEARAKLLSDLLQDPDHRSLVARMETIRVLMGIAGECRPGFRPDHAQGEG